MKKQYVLLFIFLLFSLNQISAQTIVSTSAENKNAIIEEYTGLNCQYCPMGHSIVQYLIDNNPDDVFVIKIHTGGYATPGSGQPDFRTPWGPSLASQASVNSYPSGTVNRQYFSNASSNGGTGIGLAWSSGSGVSYSNPFTQSVDQILTQNAYVNVGAEATIDYESNTLTVHVEAYYTADSPESTNYLNVALLQNNTIGPQTGSSYAAGSSTYNHEHRLVDLLTGQWGEEVNTTSSGSFINRTYTYNIPPDYNGVDTVFEDLEIVAFITETYQEIINGTSTTPTLDLLDYDIGVTLINSPTSQSFSSNETVNITITNFGDSTVSGFDVSYQIDSNTAITENFSESIEPGNSTDYSFNTTVDLSNIQDSYIITAYTNLSSDQDNSNNSISEVIYVLNYCQPAAGSCNLDGIKQFILNTINVDDGGTGCNTEPASNPLGYSDRRNLSTDLSRSSGENVYTVQAMHLWGIGSEPYIANGEGFAVWIDFDDNGEFDSNELLIDDTFASYGALESFVLTIPNDANLGQHTLRAKAIDATGGNVVTNPCDDFSYGEVQDYTVNIIENLGISDVDDIKISLFPNPSNGIFNITSQENNLEYQLFNVIGQKIVDGKLNFGNNVIDLTSFDNGIYFMSIKSNKGSYSEFKLIKN